MAYFSDIDSFYDIADTLFTELMKDRKVAQKAKDSKLIVQFVFHNPEGEFWVDCSKPDIVWYAGNPPAGLKPDAIMSMELDTGHKFWCGSLNLLGALSSKEIEAEGSIASLLKLLPVVKPAYGIYRGILKDKGLEDLIIES